ncbi:MAG: Tol-Pal system beta propeller repeat protein TolB, partial [Nitrospinaceae bacterium]|nr:Tol-Pal system beta propeller repeat protein TolB [Nitrospinaceae bacterium]NIR56578.1 Tol-Pal system beta propeller repeat protein TolB [Nitrospinaceae bacterium]NIS87040.1 Tol-Pal system beta propeller repeat protein TolB [Nitrospinaceae bacterium]NIT83884.1 Tol-Pal system beta propeller repeat protein TolB [Nitrospinaceae bacterium]NIU46087.1 Tol-Pal system beta propeller repeat protein TolB [Nitrospinaceae bacterium]
MCLKNKFLVFLILSIVSLWAGADSARGQSDIMLDLAKETQQEVRIAIPPFLPTDDEVDRKIGNENRETLVNDLRLFELFSPVDPKVYADLIRDGYKIGKINYQAWSGLGVQWLIKAEFQKSIRGDKVKFVFRLYDVVNQQFLLGKRYQGKKSFSRKIMHRFADEVMEELTGKRGVAETRLAFLSRSPEGKEMYAVDFDGANVQKLTDEQSVILSPDWSPDGKSIVYTSYKERNPDLILLGSRGQSRQPLLKLPGINSAPAWSPDGKKISLVLSKDQNSEIYVLNRWRKLTRLTRHFNIDTSPTWSPDGKQIAFTSDRSGTGRPQIYIMDAKEGDRTGVQRITFDSRYNDNPAWSPDGDKIAFTSIVGSTFQIKIYNPETRETVQLTRGRGSKEEPTWSPDGRFLAYRYSRGRNTSIHIKRIGGKKSRQLTFLPDGGFSPTWSPY